MQVNKSVLIAAALIILFLIAALAYFVGKSSHIERSVDGSAQTAATNYSVSKLETEKSPLSTAKKVEVTSTAISQPEKSVQVNNQSKPFTASEQRLIDDWAEAMEMCRGSSDDESQASWCPQYATTQAKLNTIGICYGHDDDQSAADYDIHRCRKGSYRD
jgi:hypothetical protein